MNSISIFRISQLLLCFYVMSTINVQAQDTSHVITNDIDNFWKAFDSIQTISVKQQQVAVMKALYIDNGTDGLRTFMRLRNFDETRLVDVIEKYPKYWRSIRNNTLAIKPKIQSFEKYIREFKLIFPELRPATIYFTIGAIRAAGTVEDSIVLIGTEIAMGNKHTEVSEFPNARLANFFKNQDTNNIIPIVIHEYVHTQQKGEAKILLGQCIYEGACDFITELILKTPLNNSYLEYGRMHEKELMDVFKKEMLNEDFSNWLYNGTTATTMGDLGYFIGYTICKGYYRNSNNKAKAIRDIIRLDYADQPAVLQFLSLSGF
ncbi:Predicted Zn-dependent protease [Chitinophaga sancti]|uniref:Predicted Zn-dependent protease n=2 Tax=Chitinophaga sancti TaxID=1004 RepID=A0A1K1T2X4_9BACT|nr:Predicted Zn-dependent protease [Chitinophaga sancti]